MFERPRKFRSLATVSCRIQWNLVVLLSCSVYFWPSGQAVCKNNQINKYICTSSLVGVCLLYHTPLVFARIAHIGICCLLPPLHSSGQALSCFFEACVACQRHQRSGIPLYLLRLKRRPLFFFIFFLQSVGFVEFHNLFTTHWNAERGPRQLRKKIYISS